MSSPAVQIMDNIRSILVSNKPYTSQTIQVPPEYLSLFHFDKKEPPTCHHLTLNAGATPAQLDALTDACDPATFGRGNQDVMDESYRKAGKLDSSKFSTPFDVHSSGVLRSALLELMKDLGSHKPVKAELYKLNVYGKGSFFKAHQDTPRSDTMFASIVVVFPVPHEGGGLVLRHDNKEWVYDSSKLSQSSEPRIGFVAFFSDVEHEVLPVTAGYRVTLTYNVYYDDDTPERLLLQDTTKLDLVQKAVSDLLSQPTFLSTGGVLGFGLQYSYPIEPGKTKLEKLQTHLKGYDSLVEAAFSKLGLTYRLAAVVTDNEMNPRKYEHQRLLIVESNVAPNVEKWDARDRSFMSALADTSYSTIDFRVVHPVDTTPQPSYEPMGLVSWPVAWISSASEYAKYKSDYATYGNDAILAWAYLDLCLVAYVGPAGDRANIKAITGVPIPTPY